MLVDRGNKLRISPGQQKAVTTPLPVGFISLFRSSSGLRPEVQNIKPRFSISWGDHWGSSRSWSVNIARLQYHIPVTYNVLSRHWFLQNQCKTSQIFDNTWTCRVSVVDTNLRVEWPVSYQSWCTVCLRTQNSLGQKIHRRRLPTEAKSFTYSAMWIMLMHFHHIINSHQLLIKYETLAAIQGRWKGFWRQLSSLGEL